MLAKEWMPRLPFKTADILLLDQIGKNISGSGMDTNVVGRKFNDHVAAEHEWPKIKRIIVRDLTEADARQRHAASAWPSSAAPAASRRWTSRSRGSTA